MRLIVGEFDKAQWDYYVPCFADYSIYQTRPHQRARTETNGQNLSRTVVLDDNGNVLTMCHVRIKRIWPLGLRVEYVQGGPLLHHKDDDIGCTAETLMELRDAYIPQMVDVLRLVPNM